MGTGDGDGDRKMGIGKWEWDLGMGNEIESMIPFIHPTNKMTRWTATITTWGSQT